MYARSSVCVCTFLIFLFLLCMQHSFIYSSRIVCKVCKLCERVLRFPFSAQRFCSCSIRIISWDCFCLGRVSVRERQRYIYSNFSLIWAESRCITIYDMLTCIRFHFRIPVVFVVLFLYFIFFHLVYFDWSCFELALCVFYSLHSLLYMNSIYVLAAIFFSFSRSLSIPPPYGGPLFFELKKKQLLLGTNLIGLTNAKTKMNTLHSGRLYNTQRLLLRHKA